MSNYTEYDEYSKCLNCKKNDTMIQSNFCIMCLTCKKCRTLLEQPCLPCKVCKELKNRKKMITVINIDKKRLGFKMCLTCKKCRTLLEQPCLPCKVCKELKNRKKMITVINIDKKRLGFKSGYDQWTRVDQCSGTSKNSTGFQPRLEPLELLAGKQQKNSSDEKIQSKILIETHINQGGESSIPTLSQLKQENTQFINIEKRKFDGTSISDVTETKKIKNRFNPYPSFESFWNPNDKTFEWEQKSFQNHQDDQNQIKKLQQNNISTHGFLVFPNQDNSKICNYYVKRGTPLPSIMHPGGVCWRDYYNVIIYDSSYFENGKQLFVSQQIDSNDNEYIPTEHQMLPCYAHRYPNTRK